LQKLLIFERNDCVKKDYLFKVGGLKNHYFINIQVSALNILSFLWIILWINRLLLWVILCIKNLHY